MRPRDDDLVDVRDALRWQREYVLGAGSTTAALILEAAIADLDNGGVLAELLPARIRFGDLPGLRVMAAVHRLAIDRRAPQVALWLPTLGGRPPMTTAQQAEFRRAVTHILTNESAMVADTLARTPQTNETGRAALLRCALSREDVARPVRLREIGASAGLNLRADALPGQPTLEAGPLPRVVDRLGCDLAPVDIGTVEGRSLLGSYVWVDDVDRFARLAHAMSVAQRIPARLVQQDAADFCADLDVETGTLTVLWHSAMWVYLPESTRRAIDESVASVGASARPDAPFARISWEWESPDTDMAGFALIVRRWSGDPEDGEAQLIARGRSHGTAVTLTAAG